MKGALKKQQDAITGTIKAKGGKIVAEMQSAYNGIQVTVPATQVDAVAALPGVVAVHAVTTYTIDNAVSVPFLGVPQVWQNTGYTGKNVKVGDHRHRDRLHPRELRRPWNRRRLRPGEGHRHTARGPGVVRPERAARQGGHRPGG